MKYWFKPKKFFGWFAAYYPVSFMGWLVTLAAVFSFVYFFMQSYVLYRGVAEPIIISFVPYGLAIFIIFDIVTRYTGQYPAWWKNRWGRRRGRKT